jgi:ribosomal protein S3AE
MAITKKKKRFFDVEIPLIGKKTQLQAYEIKELHNKFLKYDLTRFLRGKSMIMRFKVIADEKEATAKPNQSRIMPYYLKRMVRKGTSYVEDSFSLECADAVLRVKPFMITRKKVSRAVKKALREKARQEIIDYVKNERVSELFDDLLKNKIQKTLSLKLKKIYPLALFELRILKVEKEK